MGTNGPGSLRQDLRSQRDFVESRSPVYFRLLGWLEVALDRGLEARLEAVWSGREFGAWYERPLLLCNALRDDALREGPEHPLWRAIGRRDPDLSVLTEEAVERALAPQRRHLWLTVAERHLQTNEPTRAVAWLWPAHIASDAAPPRPIALFDVGASAGLNLIADQLPSIWIDQHGAPLTVEPIAPVVERTGFDLRPLDVLDLDDARWLEACVWPGQRDRQLRLAQAIGAFRALQSEPGAPAMCVARAGDVPGRLPRGEDGLLALVCQTIVRDYLPPAEWQRYRAGLEAWLESRPPGSALWIELEVGETARGGGPPATITVHSGGGETYPVARCEPHPARLEIDAEQVARLRSALID